MMVAEFARILWRRRTGWDAWALYCTRSDGESVDLLEMRRYMRLRSPQHMSGVRTLMWTLKHSTLHDCRGFSHRGPGALPDHH